MECQKIKYDVVKKKFNQRSVWTIPQSRDNVGPHTQEKEKNYLSPSDFIEQVSCTPENVLRKNAKAEKNKVSIFTPSPKVIVFQKFCTGNCYSIALHVRNTSQVPHHLRLLSSDNIHFNVQFKGQTLNTRLAPGMTHVYDVSFSPDEKRDYFHDIVFKTDVGTLVIPVIAVGPRPLLAFPDQIDMGQTAIKVSKTKPILMQNIGDGYAGFSFFTDNPCFTISPIKGSIEPCEPVQVQVTFTPNQIGISNGHIFLRYESGDTVQTFIFGESVKCDVKVLEENITIESTYLGLSRIESIEIKNNSDYLLKYTWMKFKNIDEDVKEREKCEKEINWPSKDIPLENDLPVDMHEAICRRVYADKVELVKNETFEFDNNHFNIFPINGELWPRNSTKVSVTFEPKEVGNLSTTAYLEIGGLENRIPVNLTGKCIGPHLELNLLSLDVQEVYLCSPYNYEIVCRNAGPVAGTLMYIQKNATFGSIITVEPCKIEVDINELKSMKLGFSSNQTGNFIERVDFIIKESSEILSFVMKGTVISPFIRADEEELEFLQASLGFTSKKQLCFRNLSHTSIPYNIQVPTDGYETAITQEEFARAQVKPKFPTCPREFHISPCEGVLKSQSYLRVELFHTPNITRSGETQLQIILCKSSNAEPLEFPITYSAKSANFVVNPPDLKIRFCFVNFPYSRCLSVTNVSEVEGYFYILPQEISDQSDSPTVLYSLSTYQGLLLPGQSKEVTVTIIVKTIGPQSIELNLLSLGMDTAYSCCEITCNGQGPVISVEPSHLDWGEVQLLQENSKSLKLTNDSPICAVFTVTLNKNKSPWRVMPPSGALDANESITLNVSVLLRDTGKYTDRLIISVFNGKTVSINLSAIGVGTAIVFDPVIFPTFDMGFLFSNQDISIPITVKNDGLRQHHLLMTNIDKIKQLKKGPIEENENGLFKIEPNIFDLIPGASQIVLCKIRRNINDRVSEPWYVYATIEGQNKREILGTSTFIATFIEPNIVFDKNELLFKIDLGCNYDMFQQEDELLITNQSGRDMNAHITIDPPFLIFDVCNCCTDSIDLTLENENPISLKFHFPFDVQSSEKIPQVYEGYLKIEYDEHKKHIDKVPCRAEINYPHLVFIPNEINLYCVTGWSTVEEVKVINSSPLTVIYRIKWLKESFVYEKLMPIPEGEHEGSMDDEFDDHIESIHSQSNNDEIIKNAIQNTDDLCKQLSCDHSCDEICTCRYQCEDYSETTPSDLGDIASIELIDKFLQIMPEEGELQPNAETIFTFTFNGFESAKMSAKAICQIGRGKPQILTVHAIADIVRCELYECFLDYGLQPFCESGVVTLKVINQCMIPLKWSIDMSTDLLRIVDGPGVLEPMSENSILIERRPSYPGAFNEKLFLEVTGYLEPFIVLVRWLATIPQVYLEDVPRTSVFEKYPVEFGYQAVQVTQSESCSNQEANEGNTCLVNESINGNTEFSEFEMILLEENGWDVISKEERYPSVIDIDMAFERVIVRDVIKKSENPCQFGSENSDQEIFSFIAPAYTTHMDYVIVEQTGKMSISVKNYGFEKAKVKLRRDEKSEKKWKSSKSSFVVQLEKTTEICQCENTNLNVTFTPRKDTFTQRRTDVSYKVYLEVRLGLTIPIIIKAAVVYPYITINRQILNFDKVYIGECREKTFLLKNEGFVNSQWEIDIINPSKNAKPTECPFYVHYSSDIFVPGKEALIKVYYKPNKKGKQKRNLIISVQNGRESEIINLVGYGIRQDLKINKTNIKFTPVVPNVTIIEDNLIIENNNPCAIELYWQHLEDFSESNKILRILKHYYNTEEILIPRIKIGEGISEILVNFYESLVHQMCSDDEFKSIVESIIKDATKDGDASQSQLFESPSVTSKSVKRKKSAQSKCATSGPTLNISCVNQNEIETLLHAYIDKLQQDPTFFQIMKDPLFELYENDEQVLSVENYSEKTSDSSNKLIIIFYGAPFTEYQETACRTAKSLKLPLLNLNQILLEALPVAQTPHAQKLKEQINNRYKDLTTKLEKYANKKNLSEGADKIFSILKKLPSSEEFEKMVEKDPYSYYEHKFDIIVEILILSETIDVVGTPRGKDKGSVKSQDTAGRAQSVLPGFGQDLFKEILKERLAQPKFKRGFILQTLINDFMKNEIFALTILLEAVGKDESYLFVTFYNSFEIYEKRLRNLKLMEEKEEQEEMNKILKKFEDMTQSQIDLLCDEDKSLYQNLILKKIEVTNIPISEPAVEENVGEVSESRKSSKKKMRESSKIRKSDVISNISLSETAPNDSNQVKFLSKEDEKISELMKEYNKNLNKILETISDWETGKQPARIKSLKNIKGKDKPSVNVNFLTKPTELFAIWHVRADDPWDRKMYDATILQISANYERTINDSNDEKSLLPIMITRTYSVFKEYDTLPKSDLINQIFFLSPQPLDENVEEEQILDARWSLEPRESRRFKIIFEPTVEGYFESEFLLTLLDDADTSFKIKVEGIAEIPKLDMRPYSVFDRVKDAKVSESHESTYFLDTQIYDFGSLLVSNNNNNRIHKKCTKFFLKNISLVPAIVTLNLTNEKYDYFEIDPKEQEIKPEDTGIINVTARAFKFGQTTDDLIISIKDNNQNEKIQLECTGIELKFDFEPKQIHLDRILLGKIEKRILMIQNQSAITMYWRLTTQGNESLIQCTPEQGKIKYKGSYEIELQCYANEIGTDTKFINFEVFLNEKDQEPVVTDVVAVTAETYDILFNVKSDNPIDLHDIPVASTASASFQIQNLGPYEIKYEIQLQDIEVLKQILDQKTLTIIAQDFKIQPFSGSILPKKQPTIHVTYTPSIETTLKNVPLIKYVIIEPYNDLGKVKEGVLNVSTTSYYTRYSIEPYPILHFGTLGLKSIKTMLLKIENTGKFPMTYSILNKSTTQPKTNAKDSGLAPKKGKTAPRRGTAGGATAATKWGPFQFEKIKGALDPGEIETITVNCSSDSIGQFDEKLMILVPDSLPKDKEIEELSVVAMICVANIDFENYNEIFAESYVVNKFEEMECPIKFSEHTVFSKMTKCLHFCCVCVGSSHVASIILRNTSPVYGDVIIEMAKDTPDCDVFEVDVNRLSIPPMSKQSFTLKFSPDLLKTFSSSLTMKVDLPPNLEPQLFSIYLIGEACVPQIKILEPDSINYDTPIINFGLSFLSKPCERLIKIENIGQVIVKVKTEILENPSGVYSVQADKLECGCVDQENDKTKVTILINPEETRVVKTLFVPRDIQRYSGRLRITVHQNPYEITVADLLGEGFIRTVIFDNLEIMDIFSLNIFSKRGSRESNRKTRKTSKQSIQLSRPNSKILNTPLMYKLDYGKCFLNRMSKINFKIANKTGDRYYRFEWNIHPNVVCTPSAGHLAPNGIKELTATFLASEPISLNQISLDCLINEIYFNEPVAEPLWDTRQTQVSWMEKHYSSAEDAETCAEDEICVKKVIREIREPEFQIIQGAMQTIQLLIFAVADYSDYECDVTKIEFNDTLMFQIRTKKFTLKNVGVINLDYLWDLTMDEQYPIRIDPSHLNSSIGLESDVIIERPQDQQNVFINGNSSFEYDSKKKLEIKFEEPRESYASSDLFSSSAGLTDRSTDSWMEGENWPFEIIPQCGSLSPGESVECMLNFLPIDVFEYKAYLRCKIENLNPSKPMLNITVTAKSLLPYCHFEIENSDYLTNDRRDPKLPGPPGYSLADPEIRNKIKVVEFKIMGTNECHTSCIHLINPTSEDYCYSWKWLPNELTEKVPLFQCSSETGVAERGKRTKIPFTTVPEDIGLFESFWQFEIKKFNLKTLFLIIANVIEPSLCCQNSLIKLEASTIGEIRSGSFEIVNNESCPLSFTIKADSLYSEGHFQRINVCPMKGILGKDSSQKFCFEYEPTLIGEFCFNVRCQVEKLRKPLIICITAQVFEVQPIIVYTDVNGQEMQIDQNCDNIIDIGQLALCKSSKFEFTITNIGQIAFDYSWNFNPVNDDSFVISMVESEGTIDPNSQQICHLEIMVLEKIVIRNYPISITIKYGPTYRLKLNASAKKPPIEFSFNNYDFGPCYIQEQTGTPYLSDLIITNHQTIPCSVKCECRDSPRMKVDLHQLSQAIPPNSSIKIPIHFRPTEEVIYQQLLCFSTCDSSVKTDIIVKGEGIPYKIHMKNPCDSVVDFGTLAVGKTAVRKINIINEGRAPVKVKAVIIDYSSEDAANLSHSKQFDGEPKAKQYQLVDSSTVVFHPELNSNTLNSSETLLEFIGILPQVPHLLKPLKELVITLRFNAVQRIKSFKAKLGLEVDSSLFPFTIVKGNCLSTSLYLNRSYISFGTIFEACSAEEKIVLINDGDVGTRFRWKTEKMEPHFNIRPLNGFCAVGSEIIFTCIFKPLHQSNNIQSEVVLALEKHKNLTLNLIGNCCSIPETSKTLYFIATISQTEIQDIEIFNDTNKTWCLKPMVLGDCFTATENLTIDPKDKKICNVTYKPKKEGVDEDEGKIVIVLPDGKQPIIYNLTGHCTSTIVSEKIVREVRAQKKIIEVLIFYNNSDEQRTFDCTLEEINSDDKKKPNTFQLDVPAKTQIHHEFGFYFENEGQFIYKVIFDDYCDNYQCYDIEFTVTSPEKPKIIDLTTYARSSIFYTLKIENPLERESITFEGESQSEDVLIHGLPATLAPLTFKNIQIEYLPLLLCNTIASLFITSEALGDTFYELNLTALPAPPQKAINVKAVLGYSTNFNLELKNHSKDLSEFIVEADDIAFTCPNFVTVPAGEESMIDVSFEPYGIETINATIKATSSTAGEFAFPVVGQITLPQPQGPFTVTPKTPTSITFKNIFLQKKEFKFAVDNKDFALVNQTASIDSKKDHLIKVKLQNVEDIEIEPKVGKLTVTCKDEALAGIKWIYYLKGLDED